VIEDRKPNNSPNLRRLLRPVALCSMGGLLLASAMFNQAQGGMFDGVLDGLKTIGEGAGKVLDGTGKAIGGALEKHLGDSDQDQPDESQGILGKVFATARNTYLGPLDKHVLGREVSARVLGKYKSLPGKHRLVGYVRKVVHALLPHSRNPTQYNAYTVIVLNDEKYINAFVAPGGMVFVSTGLLNLLKSEDELAAILSHELAHQELAHGLNAVKDAEAQKLFTAAVGQELTNAFGTILQTMDNGYGLTMEAEADERGMEIAKATGYDPAAMVTAIGRLQAIGRGKSAKYPPNRLRLAQRHLQAMGSSGQDHIKIRTKRYQQIKANMN